MTLSELNGLLSDAPQEIVVDVEHLPDCEPAWENLLGVAVSWAGLGHGLYLPCNHWIDVPSRELASLLGGRSREFLGLFFSLRRLSGWNIEHDREWIDACFGIKSSWDCDGRVLWYLTDTEQKERGYGLKKAQVLLLGWEERGDAELAEYVAGLGGNLNAGDHYLADLGKLSRYAASDAYSTVLAIEKLRTGEDWLETHHRLNVEYAAFLATTTRRGVIVDETQLLDAKRFYEKEVAAASFSIREVCKEPILQMETAAYEKRLVSYVSEKGRVKFAANVGRHPKFNPNSSVQRAELLHDRIGLPVAGLTPTGKRKMDKHSIAAMDHPSAKAFVTLSENEKLLQFAEQYIKHARVGFMHFPHDTCATVSERLGGYAPYDLNMPFNSEPIMSAYRIRPGYVGIHMDLVSIEPCLIAGFSGDATMLKVYRDGLGDVYLDLCLELFPLSEAHFYDEKTEALIRAFHKEYDTNQPPNGGIKDKFSRLRKIAKIIQLAVGYTGTKYTVSKNLTLAGFPTGLEKADIMVKRYWDRFSRVAVLANKLKALAEQRGYITGLLGRRLFIPHKLTKDSLNRFGQYGGHAILRAIVFKIAAQVKQQSLDMHPVLPDVHDSTSWELKGDYEVGRRLIEQAIRKVDGDLALPISIKGEIKQFKTFYGLKNKEGF